MFKGVVDFFFSIEITGIDSDFLIIFWHQSKSNFNILLFFIITFLLQQQQLTDRRFHPTAAII